MTRGGRAWPPFPLPTCSPAATVLAVLWGCGGAPVASDSPGAQEPAASRPGEAHPVGDGHGEAARSHGHAAHHPGAHGGAHPAHEHDFSDAAAYAQMFDAPDRDGWQRPPEVLRLLALSQGMTVADLGAGTGYFEPHLAASVGSEGVVVALDVEASMVAWMERRMGEAGLANVQVRLVAGDDPGLAPASVDRVLIVDTWHHIADRVEYGQRLRRALRPGGFVLVVDFTQESEHGPPPEMRLPADVVVGELSGAGLRARVVEESLPMQYAVRADR